MSKAPTQRDIANAAGVCQATASLALRNHPSIPETTRNRIREVAETLGYRPNPRVAELMGEIRKNRTTEGLQETVALIWADVSKAYIRKFTYLQELEQAIRRKLEEHGFQLAIWYQDKALSWSRVENILRSRGIRGVLLAPLSRVDEMTLAWNWSDFSTVTLGSACWTPEFNRVRFNHFRDMRSLVQHLREQGEQRIGLVIRRAIEERSQHGVDGGFWSALPPEVQREDCIYEIDVRGKEGFLEWVLAYQPDSLILEQTWIMESLTNLANPPSIYLRTLSEREESTPRPGLRQNYTLWGQVAAEQLIAQLQLHQFGIPPSPTQTLITGEIVDAGT